MPTKTIINATLLATTTLFASGPAQSATSYTLNDFLAGFRKSGISAKISRSIEEQTAAKTIATKAALGSWATTIESEIGTRQDDERKVAFGLSRKFAIGVNESQIDRRFAKEGEAELIAQSMDLRDQELQIATLYSELRLQKALHEIAGKAFDKLKPIVGSIQGAAKRGSIGYLASLRSELLLSDIAADLAAAESSYKSLAKVSRDVVGILLPENSSAVSFEPLPLQFAAVEFEIKNVPAYKENLLRQEALSGEADIISSQREIGASVGFSREIRSSAASVTVGIDVPIMTGNIVSSKTRELQTSRSLLAARADFIAAKASQQFQLLKAELLATQDRIKRLELRLEEIGRLVDSASRGFSRGQAEAEAVTESISKHYEVLVQKHAAIAHYEGLLAKLWTLTGEFPDAK